jgi:hypothetical protein
MRSRRSFSALSWSAGWRVSSSPINPARAVRMARRTMLIAAGKLVAIGPTKEIVHDA